MALSPSFKPRVCAYCGKEFRPFNSLQKVCATVRCSSGYVKKLNAQARKVLRDRKQALKTRSDYIKDAQAAVNKYCRLRDLYAGKSCISCGARPENKFGGAMDAGHFRSVGSAPHMRFFTGQIRLQCVRCNRYLGGNAVEYRKGLVAERGEEWVQMVESMQFSPKWTVEYLIRLIRIAKKKTRRLEKKHA